MSYRTLKRVLGETNFELKCLMLFGIGLVLLAVATFILYWKETSKLVEDQNRRTAQLLAENYLLEHHWATAETIPQFVPMINRMALEFKPEDLRDVRFELWEANPGSADSKKRPTDDAGYEALDSLRQLYRERTEQIAALSKSEITEERQLEIDTLRQKELAVTKELPKESVYQYYRAALASESCLKCHYHTRPGLVDGTFRDVAEGELIGFVKVTIPLERTREALHRTIAFVISAELVKVVLAILAIYLVVRYVITKPVVHLKKVSDAIAHGNLDMRADIRTGDEFEELSHAFNRMLRHMVTVQEELREVNADLDGKVDELAQVNLRLYELNNLKNEFLATMSHELRTPLNSILGFSDVLSHADNLTEKQTHYLDNIQSSGRQLMALINDVLDLAKIESGKMETHAIDFSVADLIERQVGAMLPMAESKNIDLTWRVDEELPPVYQDVGKMQQILNNLLSNAVKFTPEGGRVRVHAGLKDGEWCELVVEDTGIGIPLEDQDTIFEKFRQGKTIPGQEDALKRKYEGTGLGLSIVKELVKLLGGEITLNSEFGKGSTFSIRLPTHLDDADSDSEASMQNATVGVNRVLPHDLGFI